MRVLRLHEQDVGELGLESVVIQIMAGDFLQSCICRL